VANKIHSGTLPNHDHIWIVRDKYLNFAAANVEGRERKRSLLYFPEMNTDQQIQAIEQKVNHLISTDAENFLVEVKISPGNDVKVFVDADNGVSIERLVQYNRKLYKDIDESGLFANGNFSLEVSSPGLDEPLKLHRQYLKNIGRFVEVLLKDGVKREGKLMDVTETYILIEEESGKGKKKERAQQTIPFDDIKTTKIQIKF
jgi:ribosome maturation factor RimP